MRKVNLRGLAGANKYMYMAAMAYNLKKLLKYTTRKVKSRANTLNLLVLKIAVLQYPKTVQQLPLLGVVIFSLFQLHSKKCKFYQLPNPIVY